MARLTTLALAFLLCGCASQKPRILIPNTPEGNRCRNECQQLYNSCIGMAEGMGKLAAIEPCKRQAEECGMMCPGACLVGVGTCHEELSPLQAAEQKQQEQQRQGQSDH